MENHIYVAIDLKSFYASVECVERGLNPITTNLVVADEERTQKTICLAVSPALKKYGIPGRARLFEVVQAAKKLHLDYIAAKPRMALYLEYSTRIYDIYLRFIAPEDIHVYSIDEVFMDVTHYLDTYGMNAKELASQIIRTVQDETGITATAGIGTNMYLCKVALDILAKHVTPDENGICVAELDEMSYRKLLWNHRPLTDFWRVGNGYRKKLEENGLFTMGDIARCSLGGPRDYHNEELLYKLFGINAELLIDHAWGFEPTTIELVKQYKPEVNCVSSGQVLQSPYDFEKARLIVHEMTDLLVLDLVDKKLVTDQMVLTIGYDIENLSNPLIRKKYNGEITTDYYGRKVPKHAHGTANLDRMTSSTKIITDAVLSLYDRIVNPDLLVRRVTIVANRLTREEEAHEKQSYEQLTLFTDYEELQKEKEEESKALEKERRLQETMLAVKKRYGKNAMLKGMNLQEGATTIERNNQIGGHRA